MIAPPRMGYRRQWVQCKTCACVAHYDFVPYSFSNPIQSMSCGHDVGRRFLDTVALITEHEAYDVIARNRVEAA